MYSAISFDEQVEALRGILPPRAFQRKKSDATPEEWAAHLDYRKKYTTTAEFRERNREKSNAANNRWRKQNPEQARALSRRAYARRDKAVLAAKRRDYRKRSDADRLAAKARYGILSPEKQAERREKRRRWENARMQNDRQYAAAKALRTRLSLALKRNWKSGRTVELIGCSVKECLQHIESLWQPGMSWKNWGTGRNNSTWHIDHIVPVTAFDLATESGQRAAFHYTNLQPMWGSDNIKKGGVRCIRRQTFASI